MTNADLTVKKWCESKVGCGYIYGATGWVATQARLEQQAQQYPSQADTILNVGTKWIGVECYDCAAFVRKAAEQVGVKMVSGATSQWKKTDWQETGEIDDLPTDRVCFLYRDDNGVKQHTGVYQGDGTVIDSRGTKNGVIHTDLNSYPWTHWGIPKWDEGGVDMDVLYQAKVVAESGSTVNMRSVPGTDGKIVKQVKLGTIVDVYEDAEGWAHIKADGSIGYMMDKFLKKIDEVSEEIESGCFLNVDELKEIYQCIERIEEILDSNTNAVG